MRRNATDRLILEIVLQFVLQIILQFVLQIIFQILLEKVLRIILEIILRLRTTYGRIDLTYIFLRCAPFTVSLFECLVLRDDCSVF